MGQTSYLEIFLSHLIDQEIDQQINQTDNQQFNQNHKTNEAVDLFSFITEQFNDFPLGERGAHGDIS